MNTAEEVFTFFEKDIAQHVMVISQEDGIHRHLRFRNPDRNDYWFDITTWPGSLGISGDMGCYVFSSNTDMFNFFRCDEKEPIGINPSYYVEKLQSTSLYGEGHQKYCEEKLEQHVKEHFDSYVEENEVSQDNAVKLWEEIDSSVLLFKESEHEVRHFFVTSVVPSTLILILTMLGNGIWRNTPSIICGVASRLLGQYACTIRLKALCLST